MLLIIDFGEPVVFAEDNSQALVDPANLTGGIDMQVYHPVTTYVKGRPSWLLTENSRLVALPEHVEKYEGFLLQALGKNEEPTAVPIDQMVIEAGKALVLPPGKYELRIINCEG